MSKSSSRRAPDFDTESSSSGGCDPIMWVKGLNDKLMDCIVRSKWISIFVAMLPSIYLSALLMWINSPTGLPTTLAQGMNGNNDYNDPVVKSMVANYQLPSTQYAGCLAGFTIIFGLLSCVSIFLK